MNKELAKTLTTALVQFIDRERPEGTMCCSNAECEAIENAFREDNFFYVETLVKRKLSRLTEFENGLINFYNKRSEILPDKDGVYNRRDCEELLHESAKTLLALAREQFIKDGYVIEKKAFHDAVMKVDPEVMKEVSDNVDKKKFTEFEKFMDEVVDDAIRETYSKDGFYDICRDALALADMESFLNTFSKETYKDSLQVHEICKENTDSFTSLEEAAEEYAIPFNDTTYGCEYSYKGFIAGAEWRANQLLKGSPLPEDTVLFQKGVEEGRRLEKDDLALTWEDIGKIHAHLEDVFKETAKGLHDEWTVQDMYEEVSKRFNEIRKK